MGRVCTSCGSVVETTRGARSAPTCGVCGARQAGGGALRFGAMELDFDDAPRRRRSGRAPGEAEGGLDGEDVVLSEPAALAEASLLRALAAIEANPIARPPAGAKLAAAGLAEELRTLGEILERAPEISARSAPPPPARGPLASDPHATLERLLAAPEEGREQGRDSAPEDIRTLVLRSRPPPPEPDASLLHMNGGIFRGALPALAPAPTPDDLGLPFRKGRWGFGRSGFGRSFGSAAPVAFGGPRGREGSGFLGRAVLGLAVLAAGAALYGSLGGSLFGRPPSPPAPAALASFDEPAARRAVEEAVAAAGCRGSGKKVELALTFAPSGAAVLAGAGATASPGPTAPPEGPLEVCVRKAAGQVKIPPFSGQPASLRHSLTVP